MRQREANKPATAPSKQQNRNNNDNNTNTPNKQHTHQVVQAEVGDGVAQDALLDEQHVGAARAHLVLGVWVCVGV